MGGTGPILVPGLGTESSRLAKEIGMRGFSVLFGSSLLVPTLLAAPATQVHELRFAAGVFRPGEAPPAVGAWFHAVPTPLSARGSAYLTAITRGPMGRAERAQLEALGAEVLGYLPVHGYTLRLAPEVESAVRRLPFVVWLGAPPPQLKLQPE